MDGLSSRICRKMVGWFPWRPAWARMRHNATPKGARSRRRRFRRGGMANEGVADLDFSALRMQLRKHRNACVAYPAVDPHAPVDRPLFRMTGAEIRWGTAVVKRFYTILIYLTGSPQRHRPACWRPVVKLHPGLNDPTFPILTDFTRITVALTRAG